MAGLTVGVMAVPQSVSFAAMAGLPAAYGLYTAFVPVLAYCIFGSSRHLVRLSAMHIVAKRKGKTCGWRARGPLLLYDTFAGAKNVHILAP